MAQVKDNKGGDNDLTKSKGHNLHKQLEYQGRTVLFVVVTFRDYMRREARVDDDYSAWERNKQTSEILRTQIVVSFGYSAWV